MREEWKEVTLEDICFTVKSGGTPSTIIPEYYNGNIPWIKTKEVNFNRIYDSEFKITELGLKNSSAKLIPAYSIIIAMYGNGDTAGRCAINMIPLATNQACSNFTFKETEANPFFMFYLISTHYKDFVHLKSGGAQNNLNGKILKDFKVQLPPLKTQRKIASILSAYDDLIENNLKRIKLLEEKAQLTYEEWFVKMRFPGYETVKFDEVTGLPEGWENKRFGDFVKTSSGGTPSRKKETEYYEGGSIPWVRTGELKNFMLIDSEQLITPAGLKGSSAKLFPKNTVLLAMYGNTIGETSYVTFETSTNQACCGFLVEEKSYLSYFIHQYLLSNKEQILSHRMGAAQENISQSIIQNIKINLPIQNLLIDFGDLVGQNYKMIEILLNQNRLLKEARDILLPRLMSGMIDPDEISGQVAEEVQIETIQTS